MAKEPQVTCKNCKAKIDKSTAYSVTKGSYFCNEECYEIHENKNKKKFTENNSSSLLEYKNYIQELYIKSGYNKSQLGSSFWAMLMKQTTSLMQEYNIKYSTIKYVLWYMIEIKDMNLLGGDYDGTILNFVGYYSDEAKQYCNSCQEIKKMVKEFEFDDNVIIIKKSKNSENRVREIDLSEL